MTLEIISAHDVLFKGEAESVMLPGEMGSFTVLNHHAPLISVLTSGDVKYRLPGGDEKRVSVKGGLVDVDNNIVSVCIY